MVQISNYYYFIYFNSRIEIDIVIYIVENKAYYIDIDRYIYILLYAVICLKLIKMKYFEFIKI